jgi:hypothetical protein
MNAVSVRPNPSASQSMSAADAADFFAGVETFAARRAPVGVEEGGGGGGGGGGVQDA